MTHDGNYTRSYFDRLCFCSFFLARFTISLDCELFGDAGAALLHQGGGGGTPQEGGDQETQGTVLE
jgi:hypothetical protein